jgi:hypothetical protein
MRPVCVPCGRIMVVKKNGFAFIETMRVAEEQHPYKLWVGDLMECQSCGAEVISGVGDNPIAEHYQSSFVSLVAEFSAKLEVR